MMFKRKLRSLNYDSIDDFSINDDNKFRNLLSWIEETKINDNNGNKLVLKNINAENWNETYNEYMTELSCPLELLKEKNTALEWLLNYTIRLNYNNDMSTEHQCKKAKSSCDLSIDYENESFRENLLNVANKLKMNGHPSTLHLVKAISTLIKNQSQDADMKESTVASIPLEDIDLGFQTTDDLTNKAGKILRLLYVNDLRILQDDANEAIVRVQTMTANPKTDSKLGKVGR